MDTTIKCNNCDREMGLSEFLTYPEAYFMKLIVPALVPFMIAAITQKLSEKPKETANNETRGIIDGSMAGLAKNFEIACPNCGEIDWFPAAGPKPQKIAIAKKQKTV